MFRPRTDDYWVSGAIPPIPLKTKKTLHFRSILFLALASQFSGLSFHHGLTKSGRIVKTRKERAKLLKDGIGIICVGQVVPVYQQ